MRLYARLSALRKKQSTWGNLQVPTNQVEENFGFPRCEKSSQHEKSSQ